MTITMDAPVNELETEAETDAIRFAPEPDAAAILDALSGGWVMPLGAKFGKWTKIRASFDRALTTEEIWLVSGCIGYALRQWLRGNDLSLPLAQIGTLWGANTSTQLFFNYDSSDCYGEHVQEAFDAAALYVEEGSPVRKTDRAGVGTAGTSLCQGIGPVGVVFHVLEENDDW